MDWNTVAALATSVTALAAIVTAIIIWRQVKQEARLTRYSVGIETLLRCEENWNRMAPVRSRAATELIAREPERSAVEVLDFFDSVAYLVIKGVLDREIVWHTFYWPMANYWFACQDFAQETQKTEGSATWEDLGKLVGDLRAIEAMRSKRTLAAIGPSKQQVEEFLRDEKGPLR